jgi:hypothetical protein
MRLKNHWANNNLSMLFLAVALETNPVHFQWFAVILVVSLGFRISTILAR